MLGGLAPAVVVAAPGAQTVTPGTGAVVLSGVAPTVNQTFSITPDAGAIALAGLAPSVSVTSPTVTITPAAGALVLLGYAPTVTIRSLGHAFTCGTWDELAFDTDCPPGRDGLGGDDAPRRRSPHRGWNRKEWQAKKDDLDAMMAEVEHAYQVLTGQAVPAPVRARAEALVAKKVVRAAGAEPRVDWAAVTRSYAITNALIKMRQEEAAQAAAEQDEDEEEALILLALDDAIWGARQ